MSSTRKSRIFWKCKKYKSRIRRKRKKDDEYKKQIIEEIIEKEEQKEKDKEKLGNTIKSFTDFEGKINEICEQLKTIIGAIGVYITSYDYKRKSIENIIDDENALIDQLDVLALIKKKKIKQ